MKTLHPTLLLFGILFISVSGCKDRHSSSSSLPEANYPCENGLAAGTFSCDNISLYAHITVEDLGGFRANDIWGWTDPQTNTEYALVGLYDGVAFVDISDPNNPVVIGKLPESTVAAKYNVLNDPDYEACTIGIGSSEMAKNVSQGSAWRDLKVYRDHLYVVSDAQTHGMQVFDLTRLREFDGEALEFDSYSIYTKIANAHNIVINEQSGFAYAVGATNTEFEDCTNGGLHMIDIRDPRHPSFAGCYEDATPPRRRSNSAYIHDAQCVIYDGPDSEHNGKEICFSAAERSAVISDVTDKSNPVTLGFTTNPGMHYAHQGWVTDDHSYYLMNDELDELDLGRNTETHVFDIRDLDNPTFVGSFQHETVTIDHNLYIKENLAYLTNYTAGLRVLKLTDLANANMEEIAFFDTQPSEETEDEVSFTGTWSNYPFFKSGIIIVSDIEDGLFILKPEY